MTTPPPPRRPGASDYTQYQQAVLKEYAQVQALIDNEQRYDARFHALAATIGSFAWTTTIDGQGHDMLGWSAYTGLSLAECQGIGWRKALHPADNERLLQEWNQIKEELRVYDTTLRIRRRDGHHARCKIRTVPVTDTGNQVTEWVWAAKDLDEQAFHEQDTQQVSMPTQVEGRLLSAAFEAMTDGVFILDKDGHILQANVAGRVLLGLDIRSDLLHLPFPQRANLFVIYDEQGLSLPPEQMPHSRLLHGEVIPGSQAVDVRLRTLDGREMLLSIAGAPIRDNNGQIIGAVSIIRDVKERRRIESFTRDAMNASFRIVEAMVSSADPNLIDASTPINTDAIIIQVAAMTHKVFQLDFVGIATCLTEEEVLQPRAVVGPSPAEEERWWQAMTKSKLIPYVDAFTASQLRAGQTCQLTPIWSCSSADVCQRLIVPLFAHDHFLGLIEAEFREFTLPAVLDRKELLKAIARVVAMGIEQKTLLEEHLESRANLLALREANRRMDEFLGIASHELRTPMTSLSLYLDRITQLLKSRPTPDSTDNQQCGQILDKFQSMLADAKIQLRRQHRLVNDLLDFSRIHNNWFNFQMVYCNLVALVQEAIAEQRLLNPSRIIELQSDDTEIIVVADADRLRQVVNNYLDNALKYSPEDKPVSVHVQKETGVAQVTVQDEGKGLSPEQQKLVWEQFYRTAQPGKKSRGAIGLGLGLYISRTIIEKHNGHVGVSSQPGVGSTFWFTIPTATST